MYLTLKKSCGILLFRRDGTGGELRFLVLRRPGSESWEFPKGKIEAGEDELACAVREIGEECGLRRFRVVGGFQDTISYQKVRERVPLAKEVVFFLAEAGEEPVHISAEHEAHRWGTAEELFPLLKRDAQRALLRRAVRHLGAAPPGEAGGGS